MINIRPVSDLRNKYPEIEKIVLKENEEVYLTKNGYGTMVVMSIKKYEKLMSEAEEEANATDIRHTHQEIFSEVRRMIKDEE